PAVVRPDLHDRLRSFRLGSRKRRSPSKNPSVGGVSLGGRLVAFLGSFFLAMVIPHAALAHSGSGHLIDADSLAAQPWHLTQSVIPLCRCSPWYRPQSQRN